MASNLQNKQTATFQAISYQGTIPPPEMMERFKKLDPNLPERIVRMAEISIDKSFKELEIYRETTLFDLENQKKNLSIREHEAETNRMVVKEDAKYDFRAQMIILGMVLLLLSAIVILGLKGQTTLACFVAAGGFAAIIIAAIKGVSNKTKQ